MELLVGSHSFLVWVELDDKFQLTGFERIADGHHYGITPLSQKNMFLAKGGERGYTFYERSEKKSGKRFMVKDHFRIGRDFSAVHQVVEKDGGTYLANTDHNMLAWVPLNDPTNTEKRQKHHIGGYDKDINHINSIFPMGDRQVLTLMHNHGKVPSEVMIFDHSPEEGEFKVLARTYIWSRHCHNVFTDGEVLAYNASRTGRFIAGSLKSRKIIKQLNFGEHTKGLAVTNTHYIIGNSEMTNMRSRRYHTYGELIFIRRDNFKVDARVDINHPDLGQNIGNINEVRVIDQPDYSVRRAEGLDFDWSKFKLRSLSPLRKQLYLMRGIASRNLLKLYRKATGRV
jgi:hypothetical protein